MKDKYFLTNKAADSYHTWSQKAFGFRLWSWRRGMSLLATPLILGAIADLAITPKAIANELPTSQNSPEYLVQAQIIYVNPSTGTDNDTVTGSQAAPFRTITYAMSRATAGTTIKLAPGTYSPDTGEAFPINIQPGVILLGDQSNNGRNVLIIGGGNFVSPSLARQNATIRTLGDPQILGVTITNPNTRGTGIWVESSNPTISNSTFVNSKRDGVFISAEGNATITNNIFAQNDGNGISVARSGGGLIRGNLFQNTGFGISINDDSAPKIVENQIVDNRDGVMISHTAKPILRNNLIENNQRDGIVAIATAQPNLGTAGDPGQNLIRNNQRYDLYNATRGNSISAVGNEIDESRIYGLVEYVLAAVTPPNLGLEVGTISDLQGHWAQSYMEALVSLGIMSGFEDGSFRPDEPVTRVQFAAIVKNAFTPAAQQSGSQFPDVPSTFWGYQAIQSAYQGGFISGFPDGQFRPNDPITRIQSIVGLAQGLGYQSDNLDVLSIYQDAGEIPAWALPSVAGATTGNLVVNYPNQSQLNPNRVATRADVAAFVYQALVNAGKVQAINSPYLVSSPL